MCIARSQALHWPPYTISSCPFPPYLHNWPPVYYHVRIQYVQCAPSTQRQTFCAKLRTVQNLYVFCILYVSKRNSSMHILCLFFMLQIGRWYLEELVETVWIFTMPGWAGPALQLQTKRAKFLKTTAAQTITETL